MAEREALPSTQSLERFCRHVAPEGTGQWPLTEQALAKAFLDFFSVRQILAPEALPSLSEKLRVQLSLDELPQGLYGANFAFKDKRLIVVCNKPEHQTLQTHTFLHETRELIEYEFHALGLATCDATKQEIESVADEFAASVIWQASENVLRDWTLSVSKLESAGIQLGVSLLILLGGLLMALQIDYARRYPTLAKRDSH